MDIESVLERMPALPQRQDDTASQLRDLVRIANHLGMYDAADVVQFQTDPFVPMADAIRSALNSHTVREAIEAGDKVALVRTLRGLRNWSLNQSKQVADELIDNASRYLCRNRTKNNQGDIK